MPRSERPDAHAPLGRRPGLDGLRTVAVLLVLWHHLWQPGLEPHWARRGSAFVGVDVFFVLSGFLISRLLLDEHARSGGIDLRGFFARRAWRLAPLALVVVGAVAVAAAIDPDLFFRTGNDVAPWRSVLAAAGYHMNLVQMLESSHHVWALTHTWSLSVEAQFYVVWPLAVVVLLRRRPERAAVVLGALAAGVVVASTAVRLLADHAGHTDYVYNSLESRAGQLCAGALLAAVSVARPRLAALLARLGWPALAIVLMIGFHDITPGPPVLLYDMLSVVSVVLVAAAAGFAGPSRFTTTLSTAPMQWIGVRSYALYLVHYPIFLALTPDATGLGRAATLGIRVVAAFVVADLAHRCVELPAMRLRSRRQRAPERRRATTAARNAS